MPRLISDLSGKAIGLNQKFTVKSIPNKIKGLNSSLRFYGGSSQHTALPRSDGL
jgi:hypothetical protein